MESTRTFDVICPFCGKVRRGETVTDDGYDWMGHHRGHESTKTYINKCSCAFGQLVKSLPRIKPMCRNCYHYVDGYCTNSKQIAEIKKIVGNFDITVNKFSVKNINIACRMHELDYGIFDELFEDPKGRKKRGE